MRFLTRQAITLLAALLIAAPALAQTPPRGPQGWEPKTTPPPRAAPGTTAPSAPAPATSPQRKPPPTPTMSGGEPVTSPPGGPAAPAPVPKRLQPGGVAVPQVDDDEAAPRPRTYRQGSSAAPPARR